MTDPSNWQAMKKEALVTDASRPFNEQDLRSYVAVTARCVDELVDQIHVIHQK